MYLRRVVLEGIRGFEKLELDFSAEDGKPRGRTLILGRNGTCKTSVLRCIGLGLSDLSGASALNELPTGGYIRKGLESAAIRIETCDASGLKTALGGIHVSLVRKGNRDFVASGLGQEVEGLFVCGYGVGRWGFGSDSRTANRPYRVSDSVANLFDYRTSLADPELTLRRLQDQLGTPGYGAAMTGLKKALGLSEQDEIVLPRGGGVEVSGPSVGERIPLQAWADGYRLTFGWMLDLYAWASQAGRIAPSGDIEGILLLDEIEQHLHPSMQSAALRRLGEALPRMQVVATTHSPLVAMGARPDEVVPLRREGDRVVQEEAVPDFRGWSAEDLLVDDRLFDTSPYAPETALQLQKYQDLANIPPEKRSTSEKDELKDIARQLRAQQVPEIRESQAARELRKLIEKHGL